MKPWSTEEDHIIINGVQLHGHQWRLIVQDLPGRSVSSTRNRFNRIEKGRMMRESGTRGRNLCHACWKPKKGHICEAKRNGGPHVVKQTLMVHPSPLPFMVQQPAMPHVAAPSEPTPAPAPAPAPLWAKPMVRKKSSSVLSACALLFSGGEDVGAIFGEWAKADIASSTEMNTDTGTATAAATPPPLPPLQPPPLPLLPLPPLASEQQLEIAISKQQLEATAPPALLRMASGEAPTGWVPPKLTRSLSSFFNAAFPPRAQTPPLGISADSLQEHTAALASQADGGEGAGSSAGDALSVTSQSSAESSTSL